MHYRIKQCLSSAMGEFVHASILKLITHMQEKAKIYTPRESLFFHLS